MPCDMCGSEGKLYKAIIEDAELTVCNNCSKFGKIISPVKEKEERQIVKKVSQTEKEVLDVLVKSYKEIIRKKRESLNLTQKELAKKIKEKESIVHKLESGNFEPSLALAEKIGKFLNIKLIEEYEEIDEKTEHSKTESFTLGDYIKSKEK